jgi:hypothetical protein
MNEIATNEEMIRDEIEQCKERLFSIDNDSASSTSRQLLGGSFYAGTPPPRVSFNDPSSIAHSM